MERGEGGPAQPRFWEAARGYRYSILPINHSGAAPSDERPRSWSPPKMRPAPAPPDVGDSRSPQRAEGLPELWFRPSCEESGWLQQTLDQKMKAATAAARWLQAEFISLIINNACSDETRPLQSAPKARNKIPKILCILAATYFLQTWFFHSGHNAILNSEEIFAAKF